MEMYWEIQDGENLTDRKFESQQDAAEWYAGVLKEWNVTEPEMTTFVQFDKDGCEILKVITEVTSEYGTSTTLTENLNLF